MRMSPDPRALRVGQLRQTSLCVEPPCTGELECGIGNSVDFVMEYFLLSLVKNHQQPKSVELFPVIGIK